MARSIPPERFDALIRAATSVFIARGYRLTQMSDIAEAVGVAKGTLYGYVESKDALLVSCLRHADQEPLIELPDVLPIAAPPPGAIGQQVKAALTQELALPKLASALQEEHADDPRAELAGVVGEFYDLLASNRHGIKLLDRCTDHPELGELWQVAGREQSRLLIARYLESRIRGGQFREVSDLPLAARLVLETCTTWAVHIHWSREPATYEPEAMRTNAIEFLVHGLLA